MIPISSCQRCLQLPPPPPIFSLGPPPNIFSLDIHCSSRLLSSSIQHKTISSFSSTVPITLGILIALLIPTGVILLIKKRQRRYDDNSLSVKFNDHQNRTKSIPLLSDSCSSDQTLSTPASEYPCGLLESFFPNNIHHDYEQINYDYSSQYYCLVYCRQCGNYHQTSRSACTCHLRNFELQPMFRTENEDFNH